MLFSISIPAPAGILPPEKREQLIQAAFANFFGKARLSNGNPVQPDNAAERTTPPISTAGANHVISIGEFSGIAEWCSMDWQTHFLGLTVKARRQGFSEKQMAFIGLLHGIAQGNIYSAAQLKYAPWSRNYGQQKCLKLHPSSKKFRSELSAKKCGREGRSALQVADFIELDATAWRTIRPFAFLATASSPAAERAS